MGLGHQVIGIERSTTLVRSSQAGDAPLVAVQADAASLPVATGATSTVVACMSLQDIDDLRGAVDEIARILRPGGHLCMAIVHPFSSAEDPATMHTHVPSVTQSYLESRQYTDRMEHDGLAMTFVSQHRPLSTYVNALADVGLLMRELREFGNKPIPWLLTARFEKLGS
jgi:SAM-dependent methyltransferase